MSPDFAKCTLWAKLLFVENPYMKGNPYMPLKAQIVYIQGNDGLMAGDTSLEH